MSVINPSNQFISLWYKQLSEQKKLQYILKYLPASWSSCGGTCATLKVGNSPIAQRIIYTKLYTDINNK